MKTQIQNFSLSGTLLAAFMLLLSMSGSVQAVSVDCYDPDDPGYPDCQATCAARDGNRHWCDEMCVLDDSQSWCATLCTNDPSYSWCSGGSTPGSEDDLALENTPLFLGGYADPNVIFTIDDSGSMQWDLMPDSLRTVPITYSGGGVGSTTINYLFPMPANVYDSYTYATYLPEYADTNSASVIRRSSETNPIFYDPDVNYEPWWGVDDADVAYDDADPAAARYNPYVSAGSTLNLTVQQTYTTWWHNAGNTTDPEGDGYLDWSYGAKSFWPVTYFVYNAAADTDGDKADPGDFIKYHYEFGASGTTSVTFAGGTTVLVRQYIDNVPQPSVSADDLRDDLQNFANWFSYYRSRILLSRAAASQAFSTLPETYRVGFAAINFSPSTAVNINNGLYNSSSVLVTGVEPFTGTAKETWYENLFSSFGGGSTPLLPALDAVGYYYDYESGDFIDIGPWARTPGVNDGETTTDAEICRRSFNILMTDGYWNVAYGTNGNTLAEIAAHYYDNDLQPTIAGSLDKMTILDEDGDGDKSENDPDEDFDDYGDNGNTDPHMTVYTVALGVTGTLPIPALDSDLDSIVWPAIPCGRDGSCPEKIDDMLHAAANSGGRFFSASNPQEMADAITAALAGTAPTQASGASVALNSGALFNGSVLFQAKFDASDWTGQLDAYLIDSEDGSIEDTPDATFTLPTESSRNIATYACSSSACAGIPFTYAALNDSNVNVSTSDTTDLIDKIESDSAKQANAIAWLRGNTGNDDGTNYRNRGVASGVTPIGDIIHSAPVYVGSPTSPYYSWGPDEDEYDASYAAFKAAQCTEHEEACEGVSTPRKEMVYVGGNDGMLHMYEIATTETSGTTSITTHIEIGAYVPNAMIRERNSDFTNSSLSDLYDPEYSHRYYVDSTPTVGDAFFDGDGTGGKEWQTVLVSGMGAGGKGIFAINITDTTALASTNATSGLPSRVMWEFTDTDLGYTFSRPNVVRLPNGDWGVIFGNGYNGASDDAILYVVDLETGDELARISMPVATPSGVTYKNGLATVTPVDLDGDFIVDYIYAGDLYGNVWRFEIDEQGSGGIDLDISYGGAPLFKAVGPNSDVQPITTRLQVTDHPTSSGGYMVYFGTGKYLESSDREFLAPNTEIQSYYAIWDKDDDEIITIEREHLLQQKILTEVIITETAAESDGESFDYRISTDHGISWYDGDAGTTPCNDADDCTEVDNQHLGWYMDLYNTEFETIDHDTTPGTGPGEFSTLGERQVTDSVVRNNRVIFTTTVPDGNVCGASDYGWIMELDATDGSRLPYTPFDVNGDGVFDIDDYYDGDIDGDGDDSEDAVPVTGRKSKVGLLPTPGILSDYSDPTAGREYKYMSGSTGEIESLTENPGSSNALRQSWKELRWDDMINFDSL